MSVTTTSIEQHPDYRLAVKGLKKVRDCVEGSTEIKRWTTEYLPHPSSIDTTSEIAKQRYADYLMRAEFDGFTSTTLRAWVGKMRPNKTSVKVPPAIEYLINNVDGDGTPFTSALENAMSNVFQAKTHIIVADYKGLSDTEARALSIAELQSLNLRANAKQYTRESLLDWNFRRINGVMQLDYVKLREETQEFDSATGYRDDVDVILELGLDEDGYYYQRKTVNATEGKMQYVTVGGQRLTWLPVQIVSDEPLPIGKLPKSMGMLYPIADLELARYRVSADYQETLHRIPPTVKTTGWTPARVETYMQANQTKDMKIVTGSAVAINLPEGVDIGMLSVEAQIDYYLTYFRWNAEKVRALGGVMRDKSEAMKTATEADIDASEQNAMLEQVATQQEQAWRRILAYCAMFEGLTTPDNLEQWMQENITVDLPRDFATPELTNEQVAQIRELYRDQIYTREQVARLLHKGSWGTGQEIEEWLSALDAENPTPSSFVSNRELTGQTS